MAVYGIVAEYNPFHNGHKYQIDTVHARGDCDGVVAVMSGNFVQRGEAAIFPKHIRARAALLNGVDLVLELPLPFAVATAERFAQSAIAILTALGVVDKLSFGSECGELALLQQAAMAVLSPQVQQRTAEEVKSGICYPAARSNAVAQCYGTSCAEVLRAPNNILAVEYLKALLQLQSPIEPTTVKRSGAAHDSDCTDGGLISASAIRRALQNGSSIESFVPVNALPIYTAAADERLAPASLQNIETAILASLRLKSSGDFAEVAEVTQGIENRILTAAASATSLSALYDAAKTKRYTHSKIRRVVLQTYLGISKDFACAAPPYIRVLGLNSKGRALLRAAKEKATLPIVMSASDVKKIGGEAVRFYALESRSTNIYNMALPKMLPCGTEMTVNPIVFE